MIYDCNLTRERILNEVKEEINRFEISPRLVIITCSDDRASETYVKNKIKTCESVGIKVTHYNLNPLSTTEEDLRDLIFNCNFHFNGTIIQLPLCEKFKPIEDELVNIVHPTHDIDGLTKENKARLLNNEDTLIPCTALACQEILHDITNKKNLDITIVNRSHLIGIPLSTLLRNENHTVTVCHSKTKFLRTKTGGADVVITAIGKPEFFDSSYFLPPAIVLDCGISYVDGKLHRDVDIEVADENILARNVGVVTTAIVAYNILMACKIQNNY